MVPSSSTGSLKSLNFTAAFISSRSVTVPWVAWRSPSSRSPRPSRSNAMRTPSPARASSMPCFTMSPISLAKFSPAPAILVITLPPNTWSIPLNLSPPNRPLPPEPPTLFRLLLISANSCLVEIMRCFSSSSPDERALPNCPRFSASLIALNCIVRSVKAFVISPNLPFAPPATVSILPSCWVNSFTPSSTCSRVPPALRHPSM